MEDKGSKNVLDLYIKANKNKSEIVLRTDDDKEYSKAEMVVLSCLAMVARSQEDKESGIDYEKVIKTIILSSLDGMTDGLRKREEYNKLIRASKELETEEGFGAKTVYERMIEGFNAYLEPVYNEERFNAYLEPVYNEERFVNRNLRLHDRTRAGHKYWGVEGKRIENILEHIYGCLVLAVGIESEYNYKVDFNKIRKMLTLHETGEIIIGDLTEWDLPKEQKEKMERNAVVKLLKQLPDGERLIALLDEFNMHVTLESEYAYLIDKIEYDMQVKMYEKEGRYDTRHIPVNVVTTSPSVRKIIENGAETVFDVHYEYDKDKYSRIPCFRRILEETRNY